MLGLMGRIFGSPKAVEKGLDMLNNGIDALIYTDEEKASDHAQLKARASKMLMDWMAASQGQRLARRFIAIAMTTTYLALKLITTVLAVSAIWATNAAQFKASADIIGDEADSMEGAVMLILGFYFAAPYLGDIVKPAMEKFTKKRKEKDDV